MQLYAGLADRIRALFDFGETLLELEWLRQSEYAYFSAYTLAPEMDQKVYPLSIIGRDQYQARRSGRI